MAAVEDLFELDYLHVSSGMTTIPTATVRIRKQGELLEEAACGDGPVDAVYKAIDRIVALPVKLKEYGIKAVTGRPGRPGRGQHQGGDAGGQGRLAGGLSTDIIEASARAYVHALNKVAREQA